MVTWLGAMWVLAGGWLTTGAADAPACGCASVYEACLSRGGRSDPAKVVPPCLARFKSCSATCASPKECKRECGRFKPAHQRGCKAAYAPTSCKTGDPEKDKACQAAQKLKLDGCLAYKDPAPSTCAAQCDAMK